MSELKRELAMHDQLAQRSAVQYDPFTEAQQADVQQQVRHSRYSHSSIAIVGIAIVGIAIVTPSLARIGGAATEAPPFVGWAV